LATVHKTRRTGVPVEERLLPAFVQLVLEGPALPPGSERTSAHKRLSEWREQRQALLLSVSEHLGELAHALETLT
jgi:hypothetical protein